MTFMLLLLLAAEKPAAPPLQPAGKWVVDYRDTSCVLSRDFGPVKDGRPRVTVGWRVLPLSDQAELLIAQSNGTGDFVAGRALVTTSAGASEEAGYASYPTQSSGRRMTRLTVSKSLFDTLPGGATVTVAPSGRRPVSFAMEGATPAFAALETCNDDTLRVWKVDPAERQRIMMRAMGDNAAQWLTSEDYPPSALDKGQQGSTVILWTITPEGRATDCRTVVTSGTPELDAAACRALLARARYTSPALDHDGKPTASHAVRKVVWRLPDTWQRHGAK